MKKRRPRKAPRRRNTAAAALATTRYRQRIVPAKTGRRAYVRKRPQQPPDVDGDGDL